MRRALVFSGLVDANPPGDPDYLRPLVDPDPAPESLAAPAEPAPRVPAWDEHDAATDPSRDYRDEDSEHIVVRRMSAPIPLAPPPSTVDAAETPAYAEPPRSPAPPPAAAAPSPPPPPQPPSSPSAAMRDVPVHRVIPRSFNDAQHLADRFKAGTPVVLDMQGVESDLAKRLIGFASGLTYGLDGGMERLHDRVFLLSPPGVAIPEGQRTRLAAQGSLNRV